MLVQIDSRELEVLRTVLELARQQFVLDTNEADMALHDYLQPLIDDEGRIVIEDK